MADLLSQDAAIWGANSQVPGQLIGKLLGLGRQAGGMKFEDK